MSSYPRYSSSYKVTRETNGPGGATYYSSSYNTPTSLYSPSRTYHSTYMSPSVRTHSYTLPTRTSYNYTPSYTSLYTPRTGINPFLPPELWQLSDYATVKADYSYPVNLTIPHASTSLYTSLHLPSSSTLIGKRKWPQLEDPPISHLQREEHKMKGNQVGTLAVNDKWNYEIGAPAKHHSTTVPIYKSNRYMNPAIPYWRPRHKRPSVNDELRPVRFHIAVMSFFDKAHDLAEFEAKRTDGGRIIVTPSDTAQCRNGTPAQRCRSDSLQQHCDRINVHVQSLSFYARVIQDADQGHHHSLSVFQRESSAPRALHPSDTVCEHADDEDKTTQHRETPNVEPLQPDQPDVADETPSMVTCAEEIPTTDDVDAHVETARVYDDAESQPDMELQLAGESDYEEAESISDPILSSRAASSNTVIETNTVDQLDTIDTTACCEEAVEDDETASQPEEPEQQGTGVKLKFKNCGIPDCQCLLDLDDLDLTLKDNGDIEDDHESDQQQAATDSGEHRPSQSPAPEFDVPETSPPPNQRLSDLDDEEVSD